MNDAKGGPEGEGRGNRAAELRHGSASFGTIGPKKKGSKIMAATRHSNNAKLRLTADDEAAHATLAKQQRNRTPTSLIKYLFSILS